MPDFARLITLVVEDHDFQRRYLNSVLRVLNVGQVLEADGGSAALELIAGHPVDVIFLDLKMPGMDGVEFIRHLGQTGFKGSLVLASSLEAELVTAVERVAAAKGVSVLGRLEKPLKPDRTAQLLERHLERAAPARQRRTTSEEAPSSQELHEALEQAQFVPWFQPKVRFVDQRLVGVEALARWQRPGHGLCGPGTFITAMEQDGRIDRLTEIITEAALRQSRAWLEAGLELCVSINLSPLSLVSSEWFERLLGLVRDSGVSPRLVTFEVTESALAGDPTEAIANLVRLRMNGFGLSVDDYGTGYSTLQKLSEFPFTELKIDRSFVAGVHADQRLQAIVDSSVQLAGRLQLTTTAEGVETVGEWSYLKSAGGDLCQGFLVGKPMPGDEILKWRPQRIAAE